MSFFSVVRGEGGKGGGKREKVISEGEEGGKRGEVGNQGSFPLRNERGK